MKKKVLLKGPLLTRSGYGEHARFALRALRSRPDLFDIFVEPITWGKTSWINDDSEERRFIDNACMKTVAHTQRGGSFDISIQVTIPNEWERYAPVNIGYTAGIESNRIAPLWVQKSEDMDRIIVVSNHARNGFKDTIHHGTNTQTGEKVALQLSKEKPVEAVNYPVKTFEKLPKLDLELSTKFNFLCVAQFGPRKNLSNTLQWFMQEFHDDPEVGLVLKTNIARNCLLDRNKMYRDLQATLKSNFPNRKCKLYLLHGDMTDEEMHALYKHKGINAFVLLPHGEGYGLPLFEAAYSGLPIVTVGWSGQVDYLYDEKGKAHFYEVSYDIQPIQKEAVWQDVLMEDSMWAYAREKSAKKQMRQCYEDFSGDKKKSHKAACARYAKELQKRFSDETLYEQFVSHVYEPDEEVEEWLSELEEMVNV